MESKRKEELCSLLNSSGFLFQIAIENLISSTVINHNWTVLSREHPWKHKESDTGGFIDLILSTGYGFLWMVCECKRTKEGVWIFIVEKKNSADISNIRGLWIAGDGKGKHFSGWDEVLFEPESKESSFCITRGSKDKDVQLLENISVNLLKSIDCLAEEDMEYWEKKNIKYSGLYIPAILTNTKLFICEVDPNDISITDGTIKGQEFKEVQFIRFKKTLSLESQPNSKAEDLIEAAKEKERTVLVINSSGLMDILPKFTLKREIIRQNPWEVALSKITQQESS